MDLNNVMTLEPHQLTEPRIMWLQLQLQKGGGECNIKAKQCKAKTRREPGVATSLK